jgi:uncharacterized lipoprotein YbaY
MEAAARRPGPDACPDAELLGLYAERVLDDDERQGLEAHILDCGRCQAALAAFARGAPEQNAVSPRQAAGAADGAGSADRSAPWWMGWRGLVPLAATAAAVTVAVWVTRPARPDQTMTTVNQAAPAATAAPPASSVPPAAPASVGAGAPGLESAAPPAAGLADSRERQVPGAASSELRANRAMAAPPAAAAPVAPAAPAVPAGAAQERAELPPAVASEPVATATAKAVAADRAAGAARVGAAGPQAANRVQQMAELTGRITYGARQALPAGAVIEARLLDVSRADAAAETLARVEIVTRGEQVPVPFTLRYDAARIESSRRYTVQVTIAIDGRVRFRTTKAHGVLTGGAPSTDVEVVVEPL